MHYITVIQQCPSTSINHFICKINLWWQLQCHLHPAIYNPVIYNDWLQSIIHERKIQILLMLDTGFPLFRNDKIP